MIKTPADVSLETAIERIRERVGYFQRGKQIIQNVTFYQDDVAALLAAYDAQKSWKESVLAEVGPEPIAPQGASNDATVQMMRDGVHYKARAEHLAAKLMEAQSCAASMVDALHEHRCHPEYEYRMTTCGRKQTDIEGEALEASGWEPNIFGGDNHSYWERFDYHEENWYRKRKTHSQPAPPVGFGPENVIRDERIKDVRYLGSAQVGPDGDNQSQPQPLSGERCVTVWTDNGMARCVHCGLSWDMHLCDGRYSCPKRRPPQKNGGAE